MRNVASLAILFLFTVSAAKDYYGGELRTKASYTYGRFEMRMKAAAGSGLLSSFFTYHDTAPYNTWNEIDIEIMGRYHNDVQYNTITPDKANHVYADYVAFNPHEDWHVYAIEWTPTYVAWFVDGMEKVRQTDSHIATLKQEQKIMMNIWQVQSENWAGAFNPAVLPVFAYYDYVSYASYTPGKGSVGALHNFTPLWQDDFNTWDTARWAKATHTFDGNNSDFTPDNVVFRDGYMILCLTDKSHSGYTDKNPPAVLWARTTSPTTVLVHFTEAVEKSSAERVANYTITGMTVLQAALLSAREVQLTTSAWDATKIYKLICSNVQDVAAPANKMAMQIIDIQLSRPVPLPIQINVGGSALRSFLADQAWSDKVEYGYEDGNVYSQSPTQAISGTAYDYVYRSERADLKHYRVRLPNGSYNVTLMMSEQYWTQAGKRLCDIIVQGVPVVKSLDLFAVAGLHGAYEVKVDPVVVTDGELDIHFAAGRDFSLLNGLIITASTTRVGSADVENPMAFQLEQNFPNPFNNETQIRYCLPGLAEVSLNIYDLLGQIVYEKQLGMQLSGMQTVQWLASVGSGVYYYRITARNEKNSFSRVKKMIVMK